MASTGDGRGRATAQGLRKERRSIPADRPRDLKHTLAHIRELLRKQEVIQSLVHRQRGSRRELVESLVLRQHEVELEQRLGALHPAEIAHLLESLPGDQRLRLWRLVPAELDGAVLLEASDFQDTIERVVALMPIVASIGGNTGNQSVALTIRGLALDRIDPRNAPYLMCKEVGVSLLGLAAALLPR